jgi:ABC-type transport system involved in multi-copper enzyme maturation permease subunit
MSITATAARTLPVRRARLGAYAWWQLRDYFTDRGVPTFIICVLFGYIGIGPMHALLQRRLAAMSPELVQQYGSIEAARRGIVHDTSAAFLASFLGSLVFLGALLATNGIVANDRKLGFYRFLFAKPVGPPRFYGQAFLINWCGFIVVLSVLALMYGQVITPVLTPTFIAGLALMFLCYGGVAFMLSAVARWDWLSLVTVTVLASWLWGRFGASASPLATLLYLLPPLHRTTEVYDAIAGGVALPWHTVAWFAGYGAACYAIGLVVLRYRRLAII